MGEQYAKILMIFALIVMLSFSTPLITPFGKNDFHLKCILIFVLGSLYFVMKYFVDKHSLAWIYTPTEINHKVHASAINFVIYAVGFLQFYMTLCSVVRNLE